MKLLKMKTKKMSDKKESKFKKLISKLLTKEVIMYLIFGVLTTLISIITYTILTKTVLDPTVPWKLQLANVLEWVVGVCFAYVTNRKFVFESKEKNIAKEATKFAGARVSTLLLDMLIKFIGITLLKGNSDIVNIISQVLIIIGNYILSKVFVFKNKETK